MSALGHVKLKDLCGLQSWVINMQRDSSFLVPQKPRNGMAEQEPESALQNKTTWIWPSKSPGMDSLAAAKVQERSTNHSFYQCPVSPSRP